MEDSLRVLRPYLRGLPLIVIAMMIGLLSATKYLNYTTPIYESTAKIRLADVSEGVPSSNLFKDLDVFASYNKIAGEIEVIKSQIVMEKALDGLQFDKEIFRVGKIRSVELFDDSPLMIQTVGLSKSGYDIPFLIEVKNDEEFELILTDSKTHYKATFGELIETNHGAFLITLSDCLIESRPGIQLVGNYRFEFLSPQVLHEKIIKNLNVSTVDKDVAVIRISYKSPNSLKASVFVNRLANIYIQDYILTKYKAARVTVQFLEERIDNVIVKLSKAENKIQSFRDNEGITNLTQETETDLRKIAQLKIQQTNVKMNVEALRELNSYIQEGMGHFLELAPNFETFTDLLSTEIVKKIKALQAEKKDLEIIFTQEDERVKVIDRKIEDLSSYLAESIENSLKSTEVKYYNICVDIETAEKEFIGIPEKEKVLTILNREFNIYQKSYNFLTEKKVEAEIAQAAKIAFHRIISTGEVSKEPVSPNKVIITALATTISMLFAILLIFIANALKAKVNDSQTIELNSSIPVALLTPQLQTSEETQTHFLKEAIELGIKGMAQPNSILCISAYRQNEGLLFNALNLAQAFASQNIKVVVVDVEGRVAKGSNEYEVLSLTDSDNALLTTAKMQSFFNQLREDYELIIVINELMEVGVKGKLLMSVANSNLVVLDCRLSSEKRILQTELMKDEFKLPGMHFLLNRNGYYPSLLTETIQHIKNLAALFRQFKRNIPENEILDDQ